MIKETVIGVALVLCVAGVVALVGGLYGIIYLGLATVVAIVSVQLFSKKEVLPKAVAVVLNMDLIYKILMPKEYKKAIRKLEEEKDDGKT